MFVQSFTASKSEHQKILRLKLYFILLWNTRAVINK